MKCPDCRKETDEDVCEHCGHRFTEEELMENLVKLLEEDWQ